MKKYVITFFVSTAILVACHEREPEAQPTAMPDPPAAEPEAEPPAPEGPRHDENGVSYSALERGEYQDELTQGIASSRVTLPSGLVFSVISSPDIVPADQAHELQLANARLGAAQRGTILEDADAASRPFVVGDVEGRRLIYQTPIGGIVHTEVFTFESGRRTVTVFLELADPPDRHDAVANTLTRSLRVVMP